MRLPDEPWYVTWHRLLAEANPPPTRQRSPDLLLVAKTLTQLGRQATLAPVRRGKRRRRRR
jgi:hypothetical protein